MFVIRYCSPGGDRYWDGRAFPGSADAAMRFDSRAEAEAEIQRRGFSPTASYVEETRTNCEMAIEILQRTSDGHELFQSAENIERRGRNGDGWQLAIVQDAVNNHLNHNGEVLFAALHRQVVIGDYRFPLRDFISKFCPEIAG
jgi:hypothetical protein